MSLGQRATAATRLVWLLLAAPAAGACGAIADDPASTASYALAAVPGASIWDGDGGDGLWSNPLNWSGDATPQAGDRVTISGSAGEVVLDVDFLLTGPFSIKGVGNKLRVKSGVTLSVDDRTLPVNEFGVHVDPGAAVINDGTIQNAGEQPQLRGDSNTTLTNNGAINGMGVIWRGAVQNLGTMNGVTYSTIAGTMLNTGTIADSFIQIQISAVLTNDVSGVISASGRIISGSVINNLGTFRNTSSILNEGVFNNAGTLDNTTGTFENACSPISGMLGIFTNTGTFLGAPVVFSCVGWDNDAGNGLWSDPLNWSNDALPSMDADIIINTVAGDALVTIDTNVTITGQLILRNAAGPPRKTMLTIQSGQALTNDGLISAGANVSIVNQGTIVNGGEFIGNCEVDFVSTGSYVGIPTVGMPCSTWDGGGADNLWSNPKNWDKDRLPVSNSRITIAGSAGEVVLDLDFAMTGPFSIRGVGNKLRVKSGVTLSVDDRTLPVNEFGVHVDPGAAVINDGTIQNAGKQPQLRGDSNTTLTNNGAINGMGVVWRGAVQNLGTMNGVTYSTIAGTMLNSGTIADSLIHLQISARLTNQVGGVISASGNIFSNSVIDNLGTFRNTSNITNNATFNNSGTLDNTNATFNNQATLNNACEGVLVGAIIGNPPVQGACDTTPPVLTVPSNLTVEATSSQGASVAYSTSAIDDTDGAITPSCAPPSQSTFGLGSTGVTCSATDQAENSSSAAFQVNVVDTTAPALAAPPDVTREATAVLTPVVLGQASASDFFLASVTNDAPLAFPLGATTVTWTARDTSNNTRTDNQIVNVVDTTPPIVTVPPNIMVEASAAFTMVNIGTAFAHDIFATTVTHDAPELFPVGTTIVTWTARDASGNPTSAVQIVEVTDTTAPLVMPPPDVTVAATGALTDVSLGEATAKDLVDGILTPTRDRFGPFAPGTHSVVWSATDAHGNTGSATQTVHVIFEFGGFLPPLAGADWNQVKAGQSVAVMWQIANPLGGFIDDLSTVSALEVVKFDCATSEPLPGPGVPAESAGNSGLGYDARANQFHFTWKTSRAWAGQCSTFVVELRDGRQYSARFRLN